MSKLSHFAKGMMLAVMAGIFLAGSLAPIALAQKVTSNVNVIVKDESGAVVPGANLTLTAAATKTERTGVANDEGYFSFNEMSAGEYSLSVEKTGFKKTVVEGVKVDVGGVPAEVNIALVTGGVEETVMVTASEAQAVINNENASISTTVNLRQVQDLPINGRNPLALAGLQAGVTTATNNNRTATINGLRGTFSNLTWDGININDNFVRTDSLFGAAGQSVAGVAEFTITTQNGGSDEGLGVSQVRLSTPRGTTDFHGSLFEFHRNHKFDANRFFNNATIDPRTGLALPKPKLIQNQYGGNVGGPFRLPRFGEGGDRTYGKDKLFFYAYYEGTREASDASINRTVLLDQARNGVFTYRRADNNQLQSVNLLSLTGRTVDPRIARLIALQPGANNVDVGDTRNTSGFRFNSPSGSTGNLWGFRTDFDLSSKHRFEAIFSRFKFDSPNDTFNDIGEVFPGLRGGGQSSRRPRGSFAWIWSPTSNLSNEFRTGFFRQTPAFLNTETFEEGNRLTFPISTNPTQNFLQQGRVPTNYDFIDNASLVRGEHVIRFGAVARMVKVDVFNDAGILPTYGLGFNTVNNRNPLVQNTQFPGGVSANDFTTASNLLALLTGAVNTAAQTFNVRDRESGFVSGFGERRGIDYNTLSFYGGDTWRMRPNLTVNFGLRWEYVSPPTERNGLALLPTNTSLDALNDPNAVLGFAGTGTGREFHNKDLNNFAPNASFAWDPFNDGKTSVRAGYAISYVLDNNVTTVQNAAISSNAGLTSTVSLTGLGGTISGGGAVPVGAPPFRVPRTIVDNLAITQTPTFYTIDPNLKTPYVQQWNIGIQREILRDTAFEVRYVGNRGIKLTRAIDTNQTIIYQNGFLQDFLRAQSNLNLARAARAAGNLTVPITGAYNSAIPGSQDLLVFNRIGAGGLLNDPTIINLLDTNQVGELASTYVQLRRTFLTPGLNGAPGVNGATIGPGFFLPANPNAFVTDYVGNGAYSDYNGLQLEVRKRLSDGFFYQVNYTYSKAFTDFEGTQANFQGFLDLNAGGAVEKRRSANDVTHVFKANGVYELPFGPGKRFLNFEGFAGKLFGGFQLSGIYRQQSGRPINIVSARGTVNRAGRSAVNTVNTNLSVQDLQGRTGLFFNPVTGRPQLFDPALIGTDGRANPQFFQNPGAGVLGSLHQTPVSGPGFWVADMALIKRTQITEGTNIELRIEAFNVFNHTNFSVAETQDINSSSFGRITSTFDPRILQFAFKFNF